MVAGQIQEKVFSNLSAPATFRNSNSFALVSDFAVLRLVKLKQAILKGRLHGFFLERELSIEKVVSMPFLMDSFTNESMVHLFVCCCFCAAPAVELD